MKESGFEIKKVFILLLFGISIGIFISACFGEKKDGVEGFAHVLMIDNSFSPPMQKIPVGGVIEFVNSGNNPHNAISVDKSWSTEKSFGSIVMPRGSKTKVTFPQEGVFPYFCSFHATSDGKNGMVGDVVVGNAFYNPAAKSGKSWKNVAQFSGITRKVPSSYPTIQNAVDAANPGDLILISEGVYLEEVTVTTPSITIRGVDRNKVVIDGQFQRGNGIMVVAADGVVIENMTVRNATLNGFYWTGVRGFRGSYLTAHNNGDYGIYAFDSVNGVIEHSYASGSPDSGIYIGQCYPCKVILYDVVSEHNALGYSGTNSGGELYLISSVWKNNIVGVAPNTLDRELLPPERETTIIGNLIYNNNNPKAPIAALEYPSFGNGILIAGGISNTVRKNVIIDHENNGIVILPNLDENFWISHNNVVRDNIVYNSGRADIALVGPMSTGNCFSGNEYRTELPAFLEKWNGCDSFFRLPMGGDLSMMLGALGLMVQASDGNFPSGNYKEQPIPGPQMNMPSAAPVKPALTAFEDFNLDLDKIALPEETEKILKSIPRKPSPLTGAITLVKPRSLFSFFYHWLGFLLPFAIYICWTSMSLFDLKDRMDLDRNKKLYWIATITLIPILSSGIYLLGGGSKYPNWFKRTLVLGGIIAFFLLLVYTGISLMNGIGTKTIG
ncbi:right-handed parallel beta-helix repeat-containing protein [Leptospira borgpetersenii]|uniref:Periplasmic copper-binding protein NosD n=1 Tax=Leptospira borgpetersenii serovar Javanica str. UI 09931 TaxID=1049767 RepID=A0AAV3J7G9_LEPBO|nr:right-handed parallel beta-helix repeat-containing protein [Leptospira borgpetersenii]AXX16289.1 plastocyanin [Leptospira borgpetersenii serovar Ceylonica]EKQ90038.1 periplasmic copper-binding protein NosD [Leptospira borgpetersenii str. UI 09149]EMN57718.1 periplasmic copper-binding protein NosD [Leptospira borgpetersenii serovar Javanica str. MK146]EPG56403.1 periplasmic copper-binding protein NosD [Leptospira borgpetersenii serovar Javanica str. UI 09931]PTM49759.1 plastocyanin [Leptospi